MSGDELKLTRIPAVEVGMLIRKPPGEAFQWDWEMHGASANVTVS